MKHPLLAVFFVLFLSACYTPKPAATAEKPFKHNTADRDGSSFTKAIVVEATSETSGVKVEYAWLDKHYPGYKLQSQSLRAKNNIPCDILKIKTSDGQDKDVYFDISNYYGKY